MSELAEDITTLTYTNPKGATYHRKIVRIPANEAPVSKMYRLAAANAREFARVFPKDALRIVQEEILDKQK